MALFHFSAKIITRSKGQSACAAAAYRSAEKIVSEYDGNTYDYLLKRGVGWSQVVLPENAPAKYADRKTLWNSVEMNEKASNAQLAREVEFSLPRELPPEVQKQIALDFVKEQFTSCGMVADVCYHNPPKINSRHQTVDSEGNVTHDPERMVFENPHVHVMLCLRPIDSKGKWEPKKQKTYVCEKNGELREFTAEELKTAKGWEKLFAYKTENGKKEWHTKCYAKDHPELTIVNNNPKSSQVINPKIEAWNSRDSLLKWREAWAEKVNEAYAGFQMSHRIDHRSYKDQGLDLIPTIHEGKDITVEERKRKDEYERKIARGEDAVLEHTEIRNLNLAIREHNQEVLITQEIMTLRKRMEKLLAPIKERITAIGEGLAEKLEHLRAEIISIKVKIHKVIGLKTEADEQIQMQRVYISDLSLSRGSRLETLQDERNNLLSLMEGSKLLGKRRKDEIGQKLKSIDGEIRLLSENQMYADKASKEIDRLQIVSDQTGVEIQELQERFEDRMTKYSSLLGMITPEQAEAIRQERLAIREKIESEYIEAGGKRAFLKEADKVDRELGCTMDNQGREIALDHSIRYN